MAPGFRRRFSAPPESVTGSNIPASSGSEAPPQGKKKGRNKAENNILKLHTKRGGPKPKIVIPLGLKCPVGDWSQQWTTELGIICKKHIPLTAHTWKEVDEKDRETLYKFMLAKFDLDWSQPHVREAVDDQFKIRFRDYRHELHKHYLNIEDGVPKRERPPESVTQQVWESLCDWFETEKFQNRSQKNKANRQKLKVNHRGGSKAFVRHRHDQKNSETNEEPSRIEFYRNMHYNEEKGWIDPKAKENYDKMVQKHFQQEEEGSIILTDDQIADEVLGVKSGYVRGLGHGAVAPSSRVRYNRLEAEELRMRAENAESAVQELRLEQQQTTDELKQQLESQRVLIEKQGRLLEMFMSNFSSPNSDRITRD